MKAAIFSILLLTAVTSHAGAEKAKAKRKTSSIAGEVETLSSVKLSQLNGPAAKLTVYNEGAKVIFNSLTGISATTESEGGRKTVSKRGAGVECREVTFSTGRITHSCILFIKPDGSTLSPED